MIISGRLAPGQRLPPERLLAQELGLSRGSVREAVRELAALRILAARQGDGTYVSPLDSRDLFAPLDFALRMDRKSLVHYYELRLILEPHMARMDDAQRAALQEALDGYEREANSATPDSERLIAFDEQIHSGLVEASGNPLLSAIVRSVGKVARRGREVTVTMPGSSGESLAELRAVVEAVLELDPPRAQAAMTWHIARWEHAIRRELNLPEDET
jgi:DNA-binding FadR family transcriptional regulator